MRNGAWAVFVQQNRTKQGMTRRELGDRSEIDNAITVVGKPNSKRMRALSAIDRERDAQDKKWGTARRHHPAHWLAILTEELGEVARAYHDVG